jgi:hypothetical protein
VEWHYSGVGGGCAVIPDELSHGCAEQVLACQVGSAADAR